MGWIVNSAYVNRMTLQYTHPARDGSTLYVEVIRDPCKDDKSDVDEEGYSYGLGFNIYMSDGTLLEMQPDGSGGWFVNEVNTGSQAPYLLDRNDLIELCLLIVSRIQPEKRGELRL